MSCNFLICSDLAGNQHYALGQLDEAYDHYEKAIGYDKEQGNYHFNQGLVESRRDNVAKAIKLYDSALQYVTEQEYKYQAYFNRGICYRRQGDLEKSISDFKEAIKMRNDRPSAHNNLGLSCFENDEFEESLIHYKKAIDLEPSSVHYNNRGLAFYHFDKLEEAAVDFEKAIELDPLDSTIYFNLGNVYLNWKKPIKGPDG